MGRVGKTPTECDHFFNITVCKFCHIIKYVAQVEVYHNIPSKNFFDANL